LNWTANPQLSKDGQALVYNVDEGGGSSPSLRYALADGSIHVPLNRPVSRVRYDYGALSSDGAIVTYVGKVEGASGFEPFGEPNLVAMTWGSDAPPVITNVTALPEATMLRQPSSNAEHATNQQFYTVSGSSLLAMYTLPYDPATAIPPPGYGGFHEYGGILDDGLFDGLDAIAGDGIFSDNYQAIFSNMPADPLMIRAGVTASDGTASFVDVAVPVRDKIPVTAGFNMWPTVGVAPLNVSFQDTSVGDYLELRWSFVSVFTIDRVGAPGDAPAFVYADAGTYTPILVATGRGSTNEFRRTAGIRVYGSMAEMAKELAEDFEGADGDASGGLDLDEAATLIPLLDEARLTAWDKDEDQQLSRRELLEGVGGEGVVHTGDPDADYQVTLSELLRVIQFFNIGGYHCEAGTEDQYGTGAGDQGCTPHSSDYLPADWAINLSELLRFIQFFNSGGYVPDPDGEDGFRAGS
jgi:PKD repeat protein